MKDPYFQNLLEQENILKIYSDNSMPRIFKLGKGCLSFSVAGATIETIRPAKRRTTLGPLKSVEGSKQKAQMS